MRHLTAPLSREDVDSLKVGDVIELSGIVHTLRDEAHKKALEMHHRGEQLPFNMKNGVVFHCGPIMKRTGDEWELVVAGPTTSTRMNDVEPEFIESFGIRAIIGKGGMSHPTVAAMQKGGCVYLSTTGGAAVLAARGIRSVEGAHWLGLGMPEAVWVFDTNHFGPLIVSIDAHGNSLYDRVDAQVRESLTNIKRRIGI